MRDPNGAGTRLCEEPIELAIPSPSQDEPFVSQRQEALGPRGNRDGYIDHKRRWRHDLEERRSSMTLVYQCLPRAIGFRPDTCAWRTRSASSSVRVRNPVAADAAGRRSSAGAKMRVLLKASISARPCRHPDWTGPDDLTIKIQELREITDWKGRST